MFVIKAMIKDLMKTDLVVKTIS